MILQFPNSSESLWDSILYLHSVSSGVFWNGHEMLQQRFQKDRVLADVSAGRKNDFRLGLSMSHARDGPRAAWFCRLMGLFHQVGISRCKNGQKEVRVKVQVAHAHLQHQEVVDVSVRLHWYLVLTLAQIQELPKPGGTIIEQQWREEEKKATSDFSFSMTRL